jgi:hypothetical protein
MLLRYRSPAIFAVVFRVLHTHLCGADACLSALAYRILQERKECDSNAQEAGGSPGESCVAAATLGADHNSFVVLFPPSTNRFGRVEKISFWECDPLAPLIHPVQDPRASSHALTQHRVTRHALGSRHGHIVFITLPHAAYKLRQVDAFSDSELVLVSSADILNEDRQQHEGKEVRNALVMHCCCAVLRFGHAWTRKKVRKYAEHGCISQGPFIFSGQLETVKQKKA